MAGNGILITREILEQGLSSAGAYNYEQLRCLGVEFPLRSGWKRRIIGSQISQEAMDRFLALKNVHLPAVESKSPSIECQNCKFWNKYTQYCHRYPAILGKKPDDWCGEFVAHQS